MSSWISSWNPARYESSQPFHWDPSYFQLYAPENEQFFPLKMDYDSIGNASSNHWFSGDIRSFSGEQRWKWRHLWFFRVTSEPFFEKNPGKWRENRPHGQLESIANLFWDTLHGTNISHLGKKKIIFKSAFQRYKISDVCFCSYQPFHLKSFRSVATLSVRGAGNHPHCVRKFSDYPIVVPQDDHLGAPLEITDNIWQFLCRYALWAVTITQQPPTMKVIETLSTWRSWRPSKAMMISINRWWLSRPIWKICAGVELDHFPTKWAPTIAINGNHNLCKWSYGPTHTWSRGRPTFAGIRRWKFPSKNMWNHRPSP